MPEFPEPTPEQRAYAAGWSDPIEARRRRIEALANIVDGLYPAIYTPGIDDEVYYDALKTARQSLLWDLAWAGALDGAHVYTECADFDGTVVGVRTGGRDPWIEVSDPGSGCSLADFVDMVPG
jgi:hypothetical protein